MVRRIREQGYIQIYGTLPRKIWFWLGIPIRGPIALLVLLVGIVVLPGSYDEVKEVAAGIFMGTL